MSPLPQDARTSKVRLWLGLLIAPETYFDPAIPQIRAGDYPFVAIAKRESLRLITADDVQHDAAKRADVSVFRIAGPQFATVSSWLGEPVDGTDDGSEDEAPPVPLL
jgi:hypothetical protein